jgi:tetratricopeptide (TPR) repeat protein
MRTRPLPRWFNSLLLVACVLLAPALSAAQTGRAFGQVKDEGGQPLKGATVQAENEQASPSSFSAVTDDRGRFAMIGLRSGMWTFTASAPGFQAQSGQARVQLVGQSQPLAFTLAKSSVGAPSALAGLNTKELQVDLQSAETFMTSGQYDEAIKTYEAILVKAPTLTAINFEIGRAHRLKKDFASAIKVYEAMVEVDPLDDKVKVAIGMTHLENKNLEEADKILSAAAESTDASRDVFYNLGEVKFAKGDSDAAAKWYQRAVEFDPSWAKPLVKLGLVAINKGDMGAARQWLEKALAADPGSEDGAMAKTMLGQLK